MIQTEMKSETGEDHGEKKDRNGKQKQTAAVFPKAEDLWYEARLLQDPDTMAYNAGYESGSSDYDPATGCIRFPREKWQAVSEARRESGSFFAFLQDPGLDRFVGTVNYRYSKQENRYECGIIIESGFRARGYALQGLKLMFRHAQKQGIKELFDTFETERPGTLRLFEQAGFQVVSHSVWRKSGRSVQGVTVRVRLN